ncbi:MAG: CapA family protein [Deltaproteobacteria bacterium]|nr:CapA family protein [Deltaproteobacteria bacterium]
MFTALIGGDVCPIRRNQQYFISGDTSALFNDTLDLFQSVDLSIVNLECPLIDEASPKEKAGPIIGGDSRSIYVLKKAGINVLNLANNHILDHGSEGLQNTISLCKKTGLSFVGAGKDIDEASQVLIFKIGDFKIGILGYAEQECSIASTTSAGANPLSLMDYVRKIKYCKKELDYIIVLLHAGKEYYPYPPPELQKICRFIIEEGANAVICQHSHCAGAYENYGGGHIVYGQGNLIFDAYPRIDDVWCQGYLIKLVIDGDRKSEMELIPYIQSDNEIGVRKMSDKNALLFLNDLKNLSEQIQDNEFIENEWASFCKRFQYDYFSIFRGHNRLFRFLNRKFHFSDSFYSRQNCLALQNIIRCESHREAVLKILDNFK